MTRYIAAYDTENLACLAARRKIVSVHRRFPMPATFFPVGKTLETDAAEYRALLDDSLASHTYSHKIRSDPPFCELAAEEAEAQAEVFRGKLTVERVGERPCVGPRPGCGLDNDLQGAKPVLAWVREAGFEDVSSCLWGRNYSQPPPPCQPFRYKDDGFEVLWEIPGQGWHDHLLKDPNDLGARRLTLWPPEFPEAVPRGFVKTPEEEFAVHRISKMFELTFSLVRSLGLQPRAYASVCRELCQEKENV